MSIGTETAGSERAPVWGPVPLLFGHGKELVRHQRRREDDLDDGPVLGELVGLWAAEQLMAVAGQPARSRSVDHSSPHSTQQVPTFESQVVTRTKATGPR